MPTDLAPLTRFLPHLIPLFNLGLILWQQSSAGVLLGLASLLHVFSNPVDTIDSILRRQGVIQQCNIFAASNLPDVSRELATILYTYDHWLEDVRPYLVQSLKARHRALRSGLSPLNQIITEQEKYLIRDAALRLRSCHENSYSKARFSLLSYLFALMAVTYHILKSYDLAAQEETGRVASLVALFTYVTCVIYLNGRIGNFMHQQEGVRIIFGLVESFNMLSTSTNPLKPLLPLPSLGGNRTESLMINSSAAAFTRKYLEHGSACGVLNCLRPSMNEPWLDGHGGGRAVTLLISFLAIMASVSASVTIPLSSKVPSSINVIFPLLGCLLTWTINWFVSIGVWHLLSRARITTRAASSLVTTCDSIFAIILICCLAFSTSGWNNILQPDQQADKRTLSIWAAIMLVSFIVMKALVFVADSDSEGFRLTCTRTQVEALADGDVLHQQSARRPSV